MSAAAPKLILASRSPRRRQLLVDAGYSIEVREPDEAAECGICSHETPPELVARLAYQKAKDVAQTVDEGLVVGCDTVAECVGQVLGKPIDRQHAAEMIRLLQGRPHHVYSGLCLWRRPQDRRLVRVDVTRLRMDRLTDRQIQQYLDNGQWQGKAGAFGYQDGLDWVHIEHGSSSNVVGLPMELLAEMIRELEGV